METLALPIARSPLPLAGPSYAGSVSGPRSLAGPDDDARILIREAEFGGRLVDIDIVGGTIRRIVASTGAARSADRNAKVVEARGGAVLPGLHDHHVHLLSMAAAESSLPVDRSGIANAEQFAAALRDEDARLPPGQWIRAVGYHEFVAGDIDRDWLDGSGVSRPVRVQHRSGAMWVLNSAALAAIDADAPGPAGVERGDDGRPTGRLLRVDQWLRDRTPSHPLDFAAIGRRLASYGVTGVTDLTPTTEPADLAVLADAVRVGTLPMRLVVTGAASLAASASPELDRGPVKVVIADHDLPSLDWVVEQFQAARALDRTVAVHCVTREALVLAVVAWRTVGAVPGDRIEHGAVVPPDLFAEIGELGLTVVTQPGFIRERGDQYLTDVDPADQPDLWRCRSLVDAGVAVAFGTDAPYGDADPWANVRTAVDRRTRTGAVIGAGEALDAQSALDRFLGAADEPIAPRRLAVGSAADLCVLDRPLAEQLRDPTADAVAHTVVAGRVVFAR